MVARTQFNVGGMSCSFCADSIQKALERTEGVEEVDVSLAHEAVLVRYDDDAVNPVTFTDALRDLGYTIRSPEKVERYEEQQAELECGKRRLRLAGAASVVTTGLMLYMILVRGTFESTSRIMDLATLAIALATMFGPGRYIKAKAYNSVRRRIFNQHVLLEAGAFGGLIGGFLGLLVFPDFPTVHFFAVAVFITAYHILSEYTSLVVRTRASRAVQDLLDLQPDVARRVVDGGAGEEGAEAGEGTGRGETVEEVPVDELAVGDRVRVTPGEKVPIDGDVVAGESAVDESVATGESVPVDKAPGDEVIGGSVNRTGTLLVAVTATGEDAFLEQVAHQVEEARATKPGIIQLADRVLKYFVPAVLSIAALAFLFWLVVPAVVPGTILGTGPQVQTAAFAALAVLVLGYPCALGMATPLALIRGGGMAANRGILLRSGDAFQVFQDVDHAVLDKTGTITVGEPAVTEVAAPGERADAEDVRRTAAAAEVFSDHPLASAIREHADERGVDYPDPAEFESVTGQGVRATVEGKEVLVGKPGWLREVGVDVGAAEADLERLQARGQTVSVVAVDAEPVGLVAIGDEIKADARETIQRLRDESITPVMITGDNERTARAVAEEVGIDPAHVLADVLPEDKREEIRSLQDEGHRVAMVGDGINDAPALTQADVGVAIGAGTDVAIESADVVLLGNRLGGVVDAYEIAENSYRKTRQNLVAAFSFNGVGVAAATTGLVHPVFAMIAMVLSVSVVLVNSFAGQLISGEGITTEFAADAADATEAEYSGDASAD